jgi:NitT/TauT family transport system substrate-binding protein
MTRKGRYEPARRRFLGEACALSAASLAGILAAEAAEPPPETKAIRILHTEPGTCLAPQYVAEELLRLEGFSDVRYLAPAQADYDPIQSIGIGHVDMSMDGATSILPRLDAGTPAVVLAGVHSGCYELFGSERVRSIRDLKGNSAAIWALGATDHVFIASMAAYVGVDPRTDIHWRTAPPGMAPMDLYLDGKADAFLGFPPEPQQLRARNIGRVVVNTAQDRPWSQYFCCMVVAHREFVRRNPIATKRALRAILKAADICAEEPARVARFMVDRGYEPHYEVALEVIRELPYRRWRESNPEDTLRFHALRLYEVGLLKTTPQKLIAQNTDWRFLNEIKKELKA